MSRNMAIESRKYQPNSAFGFLLALAAGLSFVLMASACGDSKDSAATSTSAPAKVSEASNAHNAADVAFITGMIPHHQQAVEMSELVLAQPSDAPGPATAVSALAQEIRDAQAPEIKQMKAWLQDWGIKTEPDSSMDGMDHGGMDPGATGAGGQAMNGMMTQQQMSQLSDATGSKLDQLYLEQMIAHHEGAIEMAQTELEKGENPAALKLAQNIINSQQAEIAQMQGMLKSGS